MNAWPESAPRSSDSDKTRCNRRKCNVAGPDCAVLKGSPGLTGGPDLRWAGSARDSELRFSDVCEAGSGHVFVRPPPADFEAVFPTPRVDPTRAFLELILSMHPAHATIMGSCPASPVTPHPLHTTNSVPEPAPCTFHTDPAPAKVGQIWSNHPGRNCSRRGRHGLNSSPPQRHQPPSPGEKNKYWHHRGTCMAASDRHLPTPAPHHSATTTAPFRLSPPPRHARGLAVAEAAVPRRRRPALRPELGLRAGRALEGRGCAARRRARARARGVPAAFGDVRAAHC